jgi:hypothetical protein
VYFRTAIEPQRPSTGSWQPPCGSNQRGNECGSTGQPLPAGQRVPDGREGAAGNARLRIVPGSHQLMEAPLERPRLRPRLSGRPRGPGTTAEMGVEMGSSGWRRRRKARDSGGSGWLGAAGALPRPALPTRCTRCASITPDSSWGASRAAGMAGGGAGPAGGAQAVRHAPAGGGARPSADPGPPARASAALAAHPRDKCSAAALPDAPRLTAARGRRRP